MDQIFVLGLIFELELVTGRKVEDEDAYSIQQPIEIIQKLILD
jgi:acyl carrier protein